MKAGIEVNTRYGPVAGRMERGAAVFRGIPYGGSCRGENRFLPPAAPAPWTQTLDCTKNGPIAMQGGGSICSAGELGRYFSGGHPEYFGTDDEQKSEDCLVLNVMTPAADEKKRPVLVYIHGGGFSDGSGSLVLGAQRLCLEENIVVVGVNHRLNIFGYLYLGHLDEKYASSGMAGMLDLVMALSWVKENIASFGGDPDQVTIMGESGGGMKVSTLLAMPRACGLFQRAIVESGSCPCGQHRAEMAARQTDAVLDMLGLTRDTWREILEIPAEKLLECAKKVYLTPVADGIDLTPDETQDFTVPQISRDIPLMVGASEDEMAVFSQRMRQVTWDNIREELLHAPVHRQSYLRVSEENVDAVIETVKRNCAGSDNAAHVYVRILSMAGMLGGGAFFHAMACAGENRAKVYHYAVNFDAPLPGRPDMLCAWHTADLPLQMGIVLHEKCENVSRVMRRAVGAFVKTGDPSTEELPWPSFTQEGKMTMVFNETSRAEADPWREVRESMRV